MPFLNSNCVSSCHLTNERQSAAIRLGSAGPDNIKSSQVKSSKIYLNVGLVITYTFNTSSWELFLPTNIFKISQF